jgi:hypothetical protein
MDGFEGINFISKQDDGLQTRFAPIQYEERENHIRKLAQDKRWEGYLMEEALEVMQIRNKDCIRPEFTTEELRAIVEPVFATPLVYKDLERNKAVLERVKLFKKRGQGEEEVFSRIKVFNDTCNTPPLPEDELRRIQKDMAYMIVNQNYFQADREARPDGKILIKIGQTVDLTNGRG